MLKKGNASFLLCDKCGEEINLSEQVNLCPCCDGLLEVQYDLNGLKRSSELFKEYRRDSIWRYREFFPAIADKNIASLGEGGTPLIRSKYLGPMFGVENLFFKNDTIMPTGSFKDRGFSLAVSYAMELGVSKGFTYSSGNAGASFSAYSKRAGLNSMVLVEYLASQTKKAVMQLYSDRIAVLKFDDFTQISDMLEYGIRELGLYQFVNFLNPIRHEAMKTYAYEIFGELSHVPDYMIHPVGTGGGLWGTWKGFNELYEIGVSDSLPHMVGVQPECVSWLKHAVNSGAEEGQMLGDSTKTIAQSICGNAPLQGGKRLIKSIRESAGNALGVTDEEILQAMRDLASEGISAEPASAASVAGFRQLVRSGVINSGDTAVCVVTGSALKQPSAVIAAAGEPSFVIHASPEGITQAVKRFLTG
jgi:threonine synthase